MLLSYYSRSLLFNVSKHICAFERLTYSMSQMMAERHLTKVIKIVQF